MELLARRHDTGQPVEIRCAGQRVAHVRTLADSPATRSLPWIAPGLIDVQINGYGGQEFSSPTLTADAVAAIVRCQWRFGVTQLLPTLTTESFEVLSHGLATIDAACRTFRDVRRSVPGIHLEGPYLSGEDGPRGAHPRAHCRPPDWSEFCRLQAASGGRIRILTMSPEYPQAPEFIARATATGVVVALAHLSADGQQIRAAVDAGARLSTHLGNGAHGQLRRHPNYLWDQLAEDRLWASLIVDGHHLPPEVVKVFLRAKHPSRCLLVSDLSGLAGLPPGRYPSSGCELEILDDGRLVIAGQDQLLAGASRPLSAGVTNAMRWGELSLAEAIDLGTRRPAELIGTEVGGYNAGDPAEFVLFDLLPARDAKQPDDLVVRQTVLEGTFVP